MHTDHASTSTSLLCLSKLKFTCAPCWLNACNTHALPWKSHEKHSVTEPSFKPLSHLHKAVLTGKTDSIALHGQYTCRSINWQGPFIASMGSILQADGEFEPRSPIAGCNKDCQIKGCVGEQEAGWEEELLLCFDRKKKKKSRHHNVKLNYQRRFQVLWLSSTSLCSPPSPPCSAFKEPCWYQNMVEFSLLLGTKKHCPGTTIISLPCNSLRKFQIVISIQCCNIFVQERISSEATESPGTRCGSQIQLLTTRKSHTQFYCPLPWDKLENLHRNTNIIKSSLVSGASQRIILLWEPKVIISGGLERKSVILYKSCNFHYGEQRQDFEFLLYHSIISNQ